MSVNDIQTTATKVEVAATNPNEEINMNCQVNAVRRLDVERKHVGMSIYDMENKSGVSINSFYAWKRNVRSASVPNIVAVAESLGFEIIMRKKP